MESPAPTMLAACDLPSSLSSFSSFNGMDLPPTLDGSTMSFFSDNTLGNYYPECCSGSSLSEQMLPSYDLPMFPSMPCESLGTSNFVGNYVAPDGGIMNMVSEVQPRNLGTSNLVGSYVAPDGGIMNMVSEVQPGNLDTSNLVGSYVAPDGGMMNMVSEVQRRNLSSSKQIVASSGLCTFQSMLDGSFSTTNVMDICSTPDVGTMNMEPECHLENLYPSKHMVASSGFSTFLNASNVDICAAWISEIPPENSVSGLDSSSSQQIPPRPSVPYAPFNALNYLDFSSLPDVGTMGLSPEYPISDFYAKWCDPFSPVSQMVASYGLASSQVFPVCSNVFNATEENASATPECIGMLNRMESSHNGGDGIVFEQTNDFNRLLPPNGGRSGVHQEHTISDVAKHWGSRPSPTMGMSRRSSPFALPPDCTFNTSGATALIVSKSVSDGAEVANLVGQNPQITKEDANLRSTQNHINVAGKTSAEKSKKKSVQTRGRKATHVSTKKGNNVMMKAGVKKSESLCTKQRKLRSEVWEEFRRVKVAGGTVSAICQHCKREFDGSSRSGTTHLKNHLGRCRNRRNGDKSGNEIPKTGNLTTVAGIEDKYMVDEEPSELDLERLILKRGLTLKDGILQVYKKEKEKLRGYFGKLSSHFNWAIDHWTFSGDLLCLTFHFIDDGWELKEKIMSLKFVDCNMKLSEALNRLLSDWNIQQNMCSVVAVNDTVDHELKKWFPNPCSSPVGGRLLHASWLIKFFNYIVNDTENLAFSVLQRIRYSFNYMQSTCSHQEKFKALHKKVASQGVATELISSFELLESAVGLKEEFCELERIDADFSWNLTDEEWKETSALHECLKVLNDAACCFSSNRCQTVSLFFVKLCDIYVKLLQWEKSEYHYVHKLASCVRSEIDEKYWNNSSSTLVLAVVLDPRFKMDFVEWWFKQIYADDADRHLTEVIGNLSNIYHKYAKGLNSLKSCSLASNDCDAHSSTSSTIKDHLSRAATSNKLPKSQLECYLTAPRITEGNDFNVLTWWQVQSRNFPTVARMARDFFAIPISTVPSDSVLKAESKKIFDSGELDSDMLEALICTNNWLKTCKTK